MSLAFKLTALFIRSAAKPVGNYIRRQARDHEPFRKRCVSIAQALHRIDMRLKLGLLQSQEAIDRQIAREASAALEKHRAAQARQPPSAPTREESAAETAARKDAEKEIEDRVRKEAKEKNKRRVRPLSEAKAIDSGATFLSEAFLFGVAGGLIIFENWRGKRKEEVRRRDVEGRLAELEARLTEKAGVNEGKIKDSPQAWGEWLGSWLRKTKPDVESQPPVFEAKSTPPDSKPSQKEEKRPLPKTTAKQVSRE